ncbi:MAG TPA: RNB domain-containing ribonuclease [Acidimicrobiia bacterium]
MTIAPLRLAASAAALADDFARVRADLDVPTSFPAEVDAEAAAVAARSSRARWLPPGAPDAERLDARSLELVTVDPPGSRDLDQAFHAERQGSGFRVHYAIADVAAFVAPGGPLDREAFVRGETLYLPDGRAPLYPDVVGEGAASLLPEVDRPALLWTFELDADARPLATRCERATVHSRAAQSYAGAQAALDRGDASSSLALLRELGELLLDRERERGGVSIAAPGQEVVRDPDGSYSLELEAPLPVETWNAQISLLTGREAARLMGEAGVGLVRTLPPPDDGIVGRLRHTARALGVEWPSGAAYADVVRGLRPDTRARATFLLQALHALRGAGYAVVTPEAPAPVHAAVGAPYAHVTAPLRRLADRFANEVVLAVAGGYAPPAWAVDALPGLVEVMPRADRHAGAVDRACIDAVETELLAGHLGATFPATVVDRHRRGVVVLLTDIPVLATVAGARPVGEAALGESVTVRLDALDPVARTSTFSLHR